MTIVPGCPIVISREDEVLVHLTLVPLRPTVISREVEKSPPRNDNVRFSAGDLSAQSLTGASCICVKNGRRSRSR